MRMRSMARMMGGDQAGPDHAGLSAKWDVKLETK